MSKPTVAPKSITHSQNSKGSAVISLDRSRDRGITAFHPRKLDVPMSDAATHFIANDRGPTPGTSSGFHINPVLAQQTGIASAREQDIEAAMEMRLLEKLKVVEEEAYKKGFEQGVREGNQKAFVDVRELGLKKMEHLNQIGERLDKLFPELITHNEAQILDLIFYVARTITFRDVAANPTAIRDVLKEVSFSIQQDDSVTLRISPEDQATIEEMKSLPDQQFEYIQKVRIVADPAITRGGCMIETNYGMIDATLETRVEKIWNTLQEKKPQIKDVIG